MKLRIRLSKTEALLLRSRVASGLHGRTIEEAAERAIAAELNRELREHEALAVIETAIRKSPPKK